MIRKIYLFAISLFAFIFFTACPLNTSDIITQVDESIDLQSLLFI